MSQNRRLNIKKLIKYLQNRALFQPLIRNKPSLNLGIIVVIPCYDEDYLLRSLMSLKKCELPKGDVEVIVVINDSETDEDDIKKKNEETYDQAVKWAKKNFTPRLKFHILIKGDLPKKHAGVGLARKIGMDEACWRFHKIRRRKGIIACFDADSRCKPNYFKALENHFDRNRKCQAASIYYEHPIRGIEFEDEIYESIVLYELHLRYYINAQKWTGFPFATQTIGSSMAVTSEAYQAQGGMNKRKAGEDFYFIHKFTALGQFGEITTTKVIPSPRVSHRVPFGTGKAVGDMLSQSTDFNTYNPLSFQDLHCFFDKVEELFGLKDHKVEDYLKDLPDSIHQFLKLNDFASKLIEIQSNTTNSKNFQTRFYKWFNAFMVMKYLHFARDHYYSNVKVAAAAQWLLNELSIKFNAAPGSEILLNKFRQLDQNPEKSSKLFKNGKRTPSCK